MNEMPLSDRDFAEIRTSVLRKIERGRKRRTAWIAAGSFAFAVLAIVFVLIPRKPENRAGEAAGATQKPAFRVAPAIPPAQTVVATKTTPKKHHHPRHRAHRKPEPVAIASSEPLTIELQTANPDVRIIWIAK